MPLSHPKIMPLPKLLDCLQPLREQGKKLVFTNGCFDLLHPGHVDLLAKARALGDLLILGLNSDHSVRMQNKGKDRPVNPFAERAFVLAHLSSLDFITGFDALTPLALIEAIEPHVLVKGGDWCVERIVGREIVEKNGGETRALPLMQGYSTTKLLERIRFLTP